MLAVEFEADVKDYQISIPREFNMLESRHVKLIALFEADAAPLEPRRPASFIQKLLDNPLVVPDFQPMSREEIYDR